MVKKEHIRLSRPSDSYVEHVGYITHETEYIHMNIYICISNGTVTMSSIMHTHIAACNALLLKLKSIFGKGQ